MEDEKDEEDRKIVFPEIMRIAEAAKYLTISKYYLYLLVKGGFIPYVKLGKRIVFRQQDLYEWLGRNVIEPVRLMDKTCEVEDDFEK